MTGGWPNNGKIGSVKVQSERVKHDPATSLSLRPSGSDVMVAGCLVSLEPANPQFEHLCPVPVLDPVECGLPPVPHAHTLKGTGRRVTTGEGRREGGRLLTIRLLFAHLARLLAATESERQGGCTARVHLFRGQLDQAAVTKANMQMHVMG